MYSTLFKQLALTYRTSNISASVSSDNRGLQLRPRIWIGNELLHLKIYVIVDDLDYSLFHFVCYGLGKSINLTDRDSERIIRFNNKSTEMQLNLDSENNYLLTFDKYCRNTNYSEAVFEEFFRYIGMFQTFLEKNYNELKNIMK